MIVSISICDRPTHMFDEIWTDDFCLRNNFDVAENFCHFDDTCRADFCSVNGLLTRDTQPIARPCSL